MDASDLHEKNRYKDQRSKTDLEKLNILLCINFQKRNNVMVSGIISTVKTNNIIRFLEQYENCKTLEVL